MTHEDVQRMAEEVERHDEALRQQWIESVAEDTKRMPEVALAEYIKADFRLDKAVALAEAVGAIRYDKDKVLGGQSVDMADRLTKIMECEADKEAAKNWYCCSVQSFRYVLSRAVMMGLFDEQQANIWKTYYEAGERSYSLQRVADMYDITRNRVFYLVKGPVAWRGFCTAMEAVMSEAEYEEIDYSEEYEILREQCDYISCYSNNGMKIL